MSISKMFIPNFVCVLTKKDRKRIEQNFHSVARVMPRVGTAGAGGVKNFSVGICDGAPSTARSSLLLLFVYISLNIFLFNLVKYTYINGWLQNRWLLSFASLTPKFPVFVNINCQSVVILTGVCPMYTYFRRGFHKTGISCV